MSKRLRAMKNIRFVGPNISNRHLDTSVCQTSACICRRANTVPLSGRPLSQVSEFPEEQLLVAVFPGVPTAAELFLLPQKNQSESRKKSEEELEKVPSVNFVLSNFAFNYIRTDWWCKKRNCLLELSCDLRQNCEIGVL